MYSPNIVPLEPKDYQRFLTDEFEKLRLFLEPEPVIEIGATNAPAFQNSWVNFGTPYQDVGFYIDPFERVWLRGSMKNGTLSVVAFNVPPEYRPANDLIYSSIDGTGTPSARVRVYANGNIVVTTGNTSQIGLDGISWRI